MQIINGSNVYSKMDHIKANGFKTSDGAVHYEGPKETGFDPYALTQKQLAKNYDVHGVWEDAYKAAGLDLNNIDKMSKQYDKIEKYESQIADLKEELAYCDDDKKSAKLEKKIAKLEAKIEKREAKIDKLDGGASDRSEELPTLYD